MMTQKDKNMLAGMLLTLDMKDLKADERIATNDRDFDTLKQINKVSAAIQTILQYLEGSERKVLEMWSEGYPPEEIAHQLGIEKQEVLDILHH